MKKNTAGVMAVFLIAGASGYAARAALASPGQDGERRTPGAEVAQAPAVDALELFGELVLSSEDGAVLHNCLQVPGLFQGVATGEQGIVKPVRIVSLVSYITVKEVWQPSFNHYCGALDALSTEEVTFLTDYDNPSRPGVQAVRIHMRPADGFTWGTIRDIRDITFTHTPLETK